MESATSITSETQEVEKTFIVEGEHFLPNFTSLREECNQLKTEVHELNIKIQQLTQELQQEQIDKANLERHIQKETLLHKEIVWNLKTEVQKTQTERLSWKEKYLDLCLKTSNNSKDDRLKLNDKSQRKGKSKGKRTSKKLKKKQEGMKKLEQENVENSESQADQEQPENNQTALNTDHTMQSTEQANTTTQILSEPSNQQEENATQLTSSTEPNRTPEESSLKNEKEAQSITTNSGTLNFVSLTPTVQTLETVNIVDSISASQSLNVSTSATQNHVVSTDEAGYYNLQTGTFDLNNQAQADNTATFILQTNDATFCATAVIENPSRQYSNDQTFVLKSNTSFDGTSFSGVVESDDDSSDENTEFNFRCNLCNVMFSDKDMLARHIKSKHSAKTFICKECGKAYSTKGSLAQHTHHYHRHPFAYTCDVCKKKFNRKDFLVKHLKTHTQVREFHCKQCDKTFKTASSLSAHVNGSHNETRRFVCDFCGMRTSWRISYLEHMKLHTGEPRKHSRRKKALQAQQQQQQQNLAQLVDAEGTVVQFIPTAE